MDFLTEASWQDGAFSDRGPSVEAFAGSTGWDTAAWTWTGVWGVSSSRGELRSVVWFLSEGVVLAG